MNDKKSVHETPLVHHLTLEPGRMKRIDVGKYG